MKRSIGVTVAAIGLLLYGIGWFVAAVSLPVIIWSHTYPAPPMTRLLRGLALPMLRETVVGVGFVVTSYGIFRLRRWARVSVLSLSLGMIGFGAYMWIGTYLILPNRGWSAYIQNQVLEQFLVFLVILAVPGVWWIALFTRDSVEAQFTKVRPTSEQSVAIEESAPK